VAYVPYNTTDGITDHADANANCIVACVNACAGLNPEAVPDLLLALRAMVAAPLAYNHEDAFAINQTALSMARAAIQKATQPQ
jgi:hypothetical protein